MFGKKKLNKAVVLLGLCAAIGVLWIDRWTCYGGSRAREAALKADLQTMRNAIDNYTFDRHQQPKSLQDLVDAGYLREIPVDPVTHRKDWALDFGETRLGDPVVSPDLKAQGLYDVRSNSNVASTEGGRYNTW